jgi:hypothetical protein
VLGLTIPIAQAGETSGITSASFQGAFLEIEVENRGVVDSHVSLVWLALSSASNAIYRFNGFTLPAREGFRTLEVPLAALVGDDSRAPLAFANVDVANGGSLVAGAAIGAQWNKTGQVSIERMKIRY